ncbi:NAD(P)/FAD-dependent oxidoreductase [Thiomonas sp. FB-Cd]|uniref:dihydrolipoyl dehydrogenase family protein n=1 Tax=Thiomonas sp. FB-Cd TaxID=1158292 RepID=UPI000AB488A3|nr:NAD(P)/FAD-dependent oxidoreductase [Thiomonas sp. FB-Cd]
MNKHNELDVLVIGGGPGGTPAALALAQAGKRVLLVEAGQGLGGTCLFEGCIPSKIFREAAARRREIARAAEFGLRLSGSGAAPDIDWAAVQARRHRILSQRAQGALMKARALPSLEVVFGRARLTGPRSALIEADDGSREVHFDRAILATGSMPVRPPVPGADLPGVLDSTGLIEIGAVPGTLALIGAGPVGVEMAQIFAMLGSRVTLLEGMPRILMPVDVVLAGMLAQRLAADGIALQTAVAVNAIERRQQQHVVCYTRDGKDAEVAADAVAIVAGRQPNVAGLGLENTAVRFDQHGVKVDALLESNEPGIFATGDLVGQPMFAHWATAQALAVARHILGHDAPYPRPEHNSAVIFSYPELGMAGLTEEAARAAGLDVAVAEYDYQIDARAQISADAFGRLRVVYDRTDRRVIGVHALVEGAADLMGEAALAVRLGLRIDQLAAAIHPHPTLTEAFGLAALAAG